MTTPFQVSIDRSHCSQEQEYLIDVCSAKISQDSELDRRIITELPTIGFLFQYYTVLLAHDAHVILMSNSYCFDNAVIGLTL